MDNRQEMDMAFLEEQLRRNPDSILFARLAHIRLNDSRIDEAIKLCEHGLTKHPYYVTGHMILGRCYLAKKMYDQAEKEFKRVLHFDPKYLAAQKYYGDLMREIGWENTCEASYRKILKIDPLDETAQSMVGDYILEGGPIEDEMELMESELKDAEQEMDQVGPMADTPEEEELLFEETEPKPPTSEEEQLEPPSEYDAEIDEKKVEEFSYILEDIFKDDVSEEETETHESEEHQDVQLDLDEEDPNRYLKDLQFPPAEESKPESGEESAPPERMDDFGFSLEDLDQLGEGQEPPQPSEPEPQPPQSQESEAPSGPATPPDSEGQKIVTPTLGEIYAAQGQYAKAIGVFEMLLNKHPDREDYRQKIDELKRKLEES